MRQPAGDEPLTARSPLRTRAVMSGVTLVAAVVVAILFLLLGSPPANRVVAGICAAFGLVAVIDLAVIGWRLHR